MSDQRIRPGHRVSIDRRRSLSMIGIAGAIVLAVFAVILPANAIAAVSSCAPGWQGSVLIDEESRTNWSVENDNGSSGELALASGLTGQANQLTWNLGTDDWVQARYSFDAPLDLSRADIFGISLQVFGRNSSAMYNTALIPYLSVHGSRRSSSGLLVSQRVEKAPRR